MKVDLVCGFLKSGKTTFIKKLLRDYYQNESIVVLINEFGNVTFNQEEIEAYAHRNVFIENSRSGCICCQGNDIFIQSIKRIVTEYHPDRLVLEPSCTAKISDLLLLFECELLKEICELEHIITMVDQFGYEQRMKISENFMKQQFHSSSLVFVNPMKEATSEPALNRNYASLDLIVSEIQALSSVCLVITKNFTALSPAELHDYMEKALLTRKPLQKRMRYK